VKLLFDQNLSRRLIGQLSTLFPGSTHVVFEHLDASDDHVIWEFAKTVGYVIVSKDSDFRQLSFVYGHPPKTVWLRIGNAPTKTAADLLINNADTITAFVNDTDAALLILPAIDF
jgi:predicted nuclease of predicted toxin-antitoxin system